MRCKNINDFNYNKNIVCASLTCLFICYICHKYALGSKHFGIINLLLTGQSASTYLPQIFRRGDF
jgi:hypothetical protein